MNSRVASGSIAGLAALVLATLGTTTAAFDDNADVSANQVGAGVLQLDLDTAGATAALSFPGLEPGDRSTRMLWLAHNDASSTVPAMVQVRIGGLVDTPGACAVSRGKAEGELASGIRGCTLTPSGATGTPEVGVVSRLLDVRAAAVRAADAHTCAVDPVEGTFLPDSGAGDLARLAAAGATIPVLDAAGRPLVLAPGDGVCVAVSAYFPPSTTDSTHATATHPVDNAAQGDSMVVDFRFQLTQVPS